MDRLQVTLENAGISVWRDTAKIWPGQDWRLEIRKAIRNGSLAFIACFSENSENKRVSYQNEELVLAVEQMRKRPPGLPWLIPVRFATCSIPAFDLGAGRMLDSLQYVDLLDDNWEDGIPRLLGAVHHILAGASTHGPVHGRESEAATLTSEPDPEDSRALPASLRNQSTAEGTTGNDSNRANPRRLPLRSLDRRTVLVASVTLTALAAAAVPAALLADRHPQSLNATLASTISFPAWVAAAAFSPSGHTLAIGTGTGDQKVSLFNFTNPPQHALITTLSHDRDTVRTVAFSSKEPVLATASWDHTVCLWNIASLAYPKLDAVITRHSDRVEALAFSPNKEILATGGWDRQVFVWNTASPVRPAWVATLLGHTDRVRAAEFSPDGRTLATASYDHTVILWNVTNPARPTQSYTLTGHTDIASAVAFSPDSHILASGSTDHTVIMWDVTIPTRPIRLSTFTPADAWVQALAFSPDGRILAIGARTQTAALWNVTDAARPQFAAPLNGHSSFVEAVAFSPNGKWLVTGSFDRTAIIWMLHQ